MDRWVDTGSRNGDPTNYTRALAMQVNPIHDGKWVLFSSSTSFAGDGLMWLAGFPTRSRCRHRFQARFTRQDGRLRGRARRGQKIRYDAGHLVLLRLGITLCGRPQDEGEAKQDAFKYIELYYSRQRMRSSIGYNAPCDLERDVA